MLNDIDGVRTLTEFFHTWTIGGVGIWTLVGMIAFGWLRGLPKMIPVIIELVNERNARLQAGFDGQIARLEEQLQQNSSRNTEQLNQADRRHEECQRDNEKLRQDNDELRGNIQALEKKLMGFEAQWRQIGASTVAVLPGSMVSEKIQRAAQAVSDIDGTDNQ